eukprot:TRINITY_DN79882_c0_g1_i1.p1 TRINITY_DN79882_c0_g1~~TRINITY_DN79882_c0_g1_i1.p1  ORF type:complete len:617 (+),score=132.29 TRINITY_DN79882_c0_g1_i1:92-1852(+)
MDNETKEERQRRLAEEEKERKIHEEHEEQRKEVLRRYAKQVKEPPAKTHYTVLGLKRHSSADEIVQAYKALSKRFHPDKAVQLDAAGRRNLEGKMAQLNLAYSILSSPQKRWSYDRSLPPEPEEEEAAAAELAAASTVVPSEPVAKQLEAVEEDFDFSGDGRPFRCAKGKASRVAKACGSRDGVRVAMNQLLGKQVMELKDCGGVVRHTGPTSPFRGLGECGHPSCRAHRLLHPEVRTGFRDFVVAKVREAVRTGTEWWGSSGLRYTSLGCGELLFDLELIERLREEAGVQIEQICLIDSAFRKPGLGAKRSLREFTDWQQASGQLRKATLETEVLVFGHLADYFKEAASGRSAAGAHVFVHCDAYWSDIAGDIARLACRSLVPGGLLASLTEGQRLEIEHVQGVLVPSFSGDREDAQPFPVEEQDDDDSEEGHLLKSSIAHIGGRHFGDPFFSAAWTVKTWPAECFKPPSLQPIDHPLLSQREPKSRMQLLAEEKHLSVWRVVHKPRVAVRSEPHGQAKIVDVFYTGDELVAVPSESKGPWQKLSKESWLDQSDAPENAWILSDGSSVGLGTLLELVWSPDEAAL